jgi:hypothetical protein
MSGWYQLGDPTDPKWRGKPPQMLNEDIPTLWQFLDGPAAPNYTTMFYNVALTSVEPSTIPGAPALQAMWLYNISKRIDAVGETETEEHIIEVTSRAGIRTLGQIMAYRWLWDYTKPRPGPFKAMIVCQYADPDVIVIAESLDIAVLELNPISLQQAIRNL